MKQGNSYGINSHVWLVTLILATALKEILYWKSSSENQFNLFTINSYLPLLKKQMTHNIILSKAFQSISKVFKISKQTNTLITRFKTLLN